MLYFDFVCSFQTHNNLFSSFLITLLSGVGWQLFFACDTLLFLDNLGLAEDIRKPDTNIWFVFHLVLSKKIKRGQTTFDLHLIRVCPPILFPAKLSTRLWLEVFYEKVERILFGDGQGSDDLFILRVEREGLRFNGKMIGVSKG